MHIILKKDIGPTITMYKYLKLILSDNISFNKEKIKQAPNIKLTVYIVNSWTLNMEFLRISGCEISFDEISIL